MQQQQQQQQQPAAEEQRGAQPQQQQPQPLQPEAEQQSVLPCAEPSAAPPQQYEEEEGLCVPGVDDFDSLAEMRALAFAEKRGFRSQKDWKQVSLDAAQALAGTPKLQHCRVYKDESGRVLGGIQLQLAGDAGDLSSPEWMRHELQPGEAYVEWIACHPDATGQGIGSRLLKWADNFAARQHATFLSLEVMEKNHGALKLYERKGYVVTKDERIDDFERHVLSPLIVYFLLGFKYWSVLYMEKPLHGVPDAVHV